MRQNPNAVSGYLLLLGSVVFNGAAVHLAKAAVATSTAATVVALGFLNVTVVCLLAGALARMLRCSLAICDVTPKRVLVTVVHKWRYTLGAAVLGGTGGWLFLK